MSEDPEEDGGVKYNLTFAFDIDEQELDGLSPMEAFVLGFESSQVMTVIHFFKEGGRNDVNGQPIECMPIHARNSARVRKFAREQGVDVWISPEVDGWRELRFVEAASESG